MWNLLPGVSRRLVPRMLWTWPVYLKPPVNATETIQTIIYYKISLYLTIHFNVFMQLHAVFTRTQDVNLFLIHHLHNGRRWHLIIPRKGKHILLFTDPEPSKIKVMHSSKCQAPLTQQRSITSQKTGTLMFQTGTFLQTADYWGGGGICQLGKDSMYLYAYTYAYSVCFTK